MPELAEVETVRRTLKDRIINKSIKDVKIFYEKMIENDIEYFKKIMISNQFKDILRKGKYLIFELNDHYLISHLRMEGKYFIKDIDSPKEKHEHVIINFSDFSLRYHDTRKFGRMKLILKEEIDDYFKDLGPDANIITDALYLKDKLKNKQISIKTCLLDQSILAGLGNIYVDEVLFKSKIHPSEKGCNITLKDCENILNSAKIILDNAIKYKGTTIRSYTSSLNVKGQYQNYLCVHTKTICKCSTKIEKIKIGGRTSYYCPNCQVMHGKET